MNVAVAILVGGGAAAAASIITSLIAAWMGRRKQAAETDKTRAEQAQILTGVATQITTTVNEELTKCNAKVDALREESRQTREAVEHLTERVDEALPLLEADHPQTHRGLRDANVAVKRAL